MNDEYNACEPSPNPTPTPPRSVGKLSLMKPVPVAKEVGVGGCPLLPPPLSFPQHLKEDGYPLGKHGVLSPSLGSVLLFGT